MKLLTHELWEKGLIVDAFLVDGEQEKGPQEVSIVNEF